MGEKEEISRVMSILGSRTSAAKKRSSRLNALKGQRAMRRLERHGVKVRGRKPSAPKEAA